MMGMLNITMLNRIKQMTVSLLLTIIQTDETSQRDIYKCLRIRLPASTTMITSIRFKTAPKLSHITANNCKLSHPKFCLTYHKLLKVAVMLSAISPKAKNINFFSRLLMMTGF